VAGQYVALEIDRPEFLHSLGRKRLLASRRQADIPNVVYESPPKIPCAHALPFQPEIQIRPTGATVGAG
jgi:hypothetical protein